MFCFEACTMSSHHAMSNKIQHEWGIAAVIRVTHKVILKVEIKRVADNGKRTMHDVSFI